MHISGVNRNFDSLIFIAIVCSVVALANATTIHRQPNSVTDTDVGSHDENALTTKTNYGGDQPQAEEEIETSSSRSQNTADGDNLATGVDSNALEVANTLPMLAGARRRNRTRLLKCHCDICKDDNYICETDGLCFTSVSYENGQWIYAYRCQPKKYELDRMPIECLSSKEKKKIFTIECCETDYCNRNNLLGPESPYARDVCHMKAYSHRKALSGARKKTMMQSHIIRCVVAI